MRLIDADALPRHKQLEAMGNGQYEDVEIVYGNDIDNAPTIEAEPVKHEEWIPCSERLPKEEEKIYWICTDTAYQCECRWTNDRFGLGEGEWGWSIVDTPLYSKPIAWMPLPKPYREDDTE